MHSLCIVRKPTALQWHLFHLRQAGSLTLQIQNVFELADGSALFVTVARYRTPALVDIDHVRLITSCPGLIVCTKMHNNTKLQCPERQCQQVCTCS
jgi:hypothetical protein